MGARSSPQGKCINAMRIVVSDTGPILHLSEAGASDLLHLAGEVHIPAAVALELRRLENRRGSELPDWVTISPLGPAFAEKAALWQQAGLVHAGEAEAIALALQLSAAWLLTDDAAARMFAQTLNIEVHGSLGIILWAAATQNLDRETAKRMLDGLINSSLWVSPRVVAQANKALEQI